MCSSSASSGPHAASSAVRTFNGRPTIHIDNRPYAPHIYALTDVPGGRWSWEEVPRHNITSFYRHGFRLFQLDVPLSLLWTAPDSFSIALAVKQIRGVMDPCPEAYVFLRFHVNEPEWWRDAHEDQLTVYDGAGYAAEVDDGLVRLIEADPRNSRRASLASDVWAQEADRMLGRFCSELSGRPEGERLAGIQIAWGIYGEWHYWGFLRWEPDMSLPMTERFRRRLADWYGTDAELSAAWASPGARINRAQVPGAELRRIDGAAVFRSGGESRAVVDYYRCQHELVAERIISFAETVKRAWPEPIIVGTFYGYFFSVFNRQAAGGHLALTRVLESDVIDYLSAPQAYYPDAGAPGEPYRSRGLVESVRLHGKLWLDEYDQEPTRVFPYPGGVSADPDTYRIGVAANVATVMRSVASTAARGSGLWYYDFGPAGVHLSKDSVHASQSGVAGYWDKPPYMKAIGDLRKLAERLMEVPYEPAADVLLVYDTEVFYYLKSEVRDPDPITHRLTDWTTRAAWYSGFVFETILLSDLPLVDLDRYRAVVFVNTFRLSSDERHHIRTAVAGNGRHVAWMYAPGILEGDTGLPPAGELERRVTDLTGVHVRVREAVSDTPVVTSSGVVDFDDEQPDGPCEPVLEVSDKEVVSIGAYRPDGSTAFCRKQLSDSVAWYFGVPVTDYRLIAHLFADAGAHQYAAAGNVVYAGSGIVVVHTAEGYIDEVRLRGGTVLGLTGTAAPAEKVPLTVVVDAANGKTLLRSTDYGVRYR